MPVSDYLMTLGNFSVRVQPERLRRIVQPIVRAGFTPTLAWATICITPTKLADPNPSKATVMANARYSGRILETDWAEGELSGHHILGWMGDDQGQGQFDGLVLPPKTYAQMIVAGFADGHDLGQGITIGTDYGSPATVINGDGLVTKETFRAGIDRWCRIVDAEYRCNPDGTFDYGTPAGGLFKTTPDVLLLEDDGGQDPSGVFGMRSTIKRRPNARSMITNVWVVGNGVTGSQTGASFGNLSGTNQASIWRKLTSNSNYAGDLTTQALKEWEDNSVEQNEFDVTTDVFDPGRYLTPGDVVAVYSPRNFVAGIFDPISYHGRLIQPWEYRCVGIEGWKVHKPMGVYLILTNLTDGAIYPVNSVFPLHDSMIWDADSPARLVLDKLPRQLGWAFTPRDH